jgi:hypothetical protein
MSSSYQPRDPRAKLREVSAKWVSAMRVTGLAPNRGIVFAGDSSTPAAPQLHGLLVDDRRPQASGARYLVLEDGDVLRAPDETWLAEPNDELVTLFSRALADARMGCSGGWPTAATRSRASPTVAGNVVPTKARSAAVAADRRAPRRRRLAAVATLWYKQGCERPRA